MTWDPSNTESWFRWLDDHGYLLSVDQFSRQYTNPTHPYTRSQASDEAANQTFAWADNLSNAFYNAFPIGNGDFIRLRNRVIAYYGDMWDHLGSVPPGPSPGVCLLTIVLI